MAGQATRWQATRWQATRWNGPAFILAGVIILSMSFVMGEAANRPLLKQPIGVWGAISLGAILTLLGLILFIQSRSQSPEEWARRSEENDFVVSLRLWLIVAAVDGDLKGSEIDVIRRNALQYFGRDIDDAFVRETYSAVKKRTTVKAIEEELLSSAMPLTAEGIRNTLLGAISVALFDGELDQDEKRVIDELADVFNLDADSIDQLIGDVSADISTC
jgi:tellurite resistance protein